MNFSFIWCKDVGRTFVRFVIIHACDGQTDSSTIRKTALHTMQRGENDVRCYCNVDNLPEDTYYVSQAGVFVTGRTTAVKSVSRAPVCESLLLLVIANTVDRVYTVLFRSSDSPPAASDSCLRACFPSFILLKPADGN